MKRHWNSAYISVLLLGACVSVFAQAETYLAHNPPWAGCWIWGAAENAPPVEVDISRWLRAHPGGWGKPLVRRILGIAANVGLREIYWDMQDDKGMLLYPSKESNRVRRWTSWGVDFETTDMPALAIETAKTLQQNLTLVAPESLHKEIKERYSDVVVISPKDVPADAIPGTEITRENLGVLGKYQNPNAQYFRKIFEVKAPVQSAELCITAMQPYRVYMDGKLIGSDSTWQDGETYNVTDRMSVGRHVLAVEVKGLNKPSWEAGLIANLRWIGKDNRTNLIVTDARWRRTETMEKDWFLPKYDDSGWKPSTVVGVEGVGERFLRLGAPWGNPRPLLSNQVCGDMLITDVRVRGEKNPKVAYVVMDRGIHDTHSARWTCKGLPATMEFQLPRKERVGGIRIYSGWLRAVFAPSGPGEVKQFQLQAMVSGKWTNVCAVQNAPPYQREFPLSGYYYEVFFKPVLCDRLRLIVLESHDAGWRFTNLGGTPAPLSQRLCNIREIELLRAE